MIGKPKRLKKSQKSLNGKTDKKNSLNRKVLHYVLAAGFVFAPWLGGEAYAGDIVRIDANGAPIGDNLMQNGVADIYAGEVDTSGKVGLNRFNTFTVKNGEIANLYFKNSPTGSALDTLVNTVESPINISGVVNGIRNNTISGNLYLISPKGIVVGSTGVINAGSLTLAVSDPNTHGYGYSHYFTSADMAAKAVKDRGWEPLNPEGKIEIYGQINTATGIDLGAVDMVLGDNSSLKTGMVFRETVNTDNISQQNDNILTDKRLTALKDENGNIIVLDADDLLFADQYGTTGSGNIFLSARRSYEGELLGNVISNGVLDAVGSVKMEAGDSITFGEKASIDSGNLAKIVTETGSMSNDGNIDATQRINITVGNSLSNSSDANFINRGTICSTDGGFSLTARNSVLNLGTIKSSGESKFTAGNTIINTGEIISENSNVQAHIGRNFCNISRKSDLYKNELDDSYVEIAPVVPANGVPDCIIDAIPGNTDPAEPFAAKIQANGNVQVDYNLEYMNATGSGTPSGIYNTGTIKTTGNEDPIIGSDGEVNASSGSGNIWLTSSYNIVNDGTIDAGRQITLNARDQLINRGIIQGVSYLDIKSIMGSVHNCDSGEIIATDGYIDLSAGQRNPIIQGDRSYLDFTSLVLEGTVKADAGKSTKEERGNITITANLDDIYVDGGTIEATGDVILNARRNIAIGYQTERAWQDDPTTDVPDEREYFRIKKNEDTSPVPSTKTATISGSNIILIAGGANPTDKQAESEGRAAGELNINGTLSATAGNVEINADKDKIIIDGGSISATGGDVNITASKNDVVINSGTVSSTDGNMQLTAGDTVNITAGGELSVGNTLSINGNNNVNISKDITAGSVDIASKNLNLVDYDITATTGGVKLTNTQDESASTTGTLTITGTISANNGIEINADKEEIIVGGSISATGGDVNITANGNSVAINRGNVSAMDGNVEINAAKDITIGKDEDTDTNVVAKADKNMNGGNMQLTAGDTVNIISGTVDADNSLSIKGNNSVNISNDITAGSVDIASADLNLGNNNINATKGDLKLTTEQGTGTGDSAMTITGNLTAQKGSIEIKAANDEIIVNGSTVSAGSDVNINSGQNKILINSGTVSAAAGSVEINAANDEIIIDGSTVSATGGNVEMNAAKDITIRNNAETGKNAEVVASAGDSDANSGNIHLTAGNLVNIKGSTVSTEESIFITGKKDVIIEDNNNTIVRAGKELSIVSNKTPDFGNSIVNPINVIAKLLDSASQNTLTEMEMADKKLDTSAPGVLIETSAQAVTGDSLLPQDKKKVLKQDENGLSIEDKEE